jgi:hypothetical protein
VGELARKGESVADPLEPYRALGPEDGEFANMYVPAPPEGKAEFVCGDG